MTTETDALAAMNAALSGEAAPATEDPADETTEIDAGSDSAGGETPSGDAGDAATPDGAVDEQQPDEGADAGTEGGEKGEGNEINDRGDGRNAKGEFVKKPGEVAKEADDVAKAAAAKPAAKAKDPVNDPIPAGLKKETHERMQSLITTAKTLTAERDDAVAKHEEMMGYITESRATPEQYGQALNYLKMVNSGDPAQIEQCIAFMQGELTALSKILGKPVKGVDVLSDHADLKQKVADGALSLEDAEELAAARNSTALRTEHARYSREEGTRAQEFQAAVTAAKADLNSLEVQLRARDPDYDAKRPTILAALRAKDPQTGRTLMESAPPAQWQGLFLKHYALASAPTPRPGAKPAGKSKNQPLRARNPAGAAVSAPKSALDAMNLALGGARS